MAHKPVNEDSDNAAIDWFGRMRLNTPSAFDVAAFERWRSARPEHAAAFDRAEQVWQELGDLQTLPESREFFDEVAQLVKPRPRFYQRHRVSLALAAGIAAVALVLVPQLFGGRQYETQTAEVRALNLPDGSRVTLGAQSRIELSFTDTERRLRLEGGEAFFEVHKDPKRPFIVDAGAARIRVLGTKFDVHRGREQIDVAVLEGLVEVLPAPAARPRIRSEAAEAPIHVLKAGQQLSIGADQPNVVPRPTSLNTPPGSWRTGRLSYDSARLIEVIADANRYYPAGVSLASAELADFKVTTAFSVDQIDPLINSLTQALPLTARRDASGHVTLESSAQNAR